MNPISKVILSKPALKLFLPELDPWNEDQEVSPTGSGVSNNLSFDDLIEEAKRDRPDDRSGQPR